MTKPLFRREVAEARRSAWLGEAQIDAANIHSQNVIPIT